ncbi:MAG: hypothetical protein KKF27_21720 [Gammaproteobacteria bacterium]|nr:hypothetical protein [Gammaproteobacteria bacterium]MBU2685869.1 hypothetical protein [Gammaproteobacteria bacterium]
MTDVTIGSSTTITQGYLVVLRCTNGNGGMADNTNMRLQANFSFDSADDTITMISNGSTWYEIARADNA